MSPAIRYDEYKGNSQVRWQPPVRIQPGGSPVRHYCTRGPTMTEHTGQRAGS